MNPKIGCWAILLTVLITASARADVAVPEPLQVWEPWVLQKHDHLTCPVAVPGGDYRCIWVGATSLDVSSRGAQFSLDVTTFADRFVDLPGNDRYWPLEVRDRQGSLPVRAARGRPQVFLAAGRHRITGRIPWTRIPNNLPLPPQSGLVSLKMDGISVGQPEFDRAGNIWLRQNRAAKSAPEAKNSLDLQVYRLIEDDVPVRLHTRLVLEVSGEAREVRVGQMLLGNFQPLRLDSPVPARIEADGALRLQITSGRHVVSLEARHQGPLEALTAKALTESWPENEIWAFKADRNLRTVSFSGAQSIDPSQTSAPQEWRDFPHYRLQDGQTLATETMHRGDPSPEADNLSLSRTLYLDFDGGGFTVSDSMTGKVQRSWRLDSDASVTLGRVTLGQQPQLITRSDDGETEGIEIRQTELDMEAVGRIEGRSELAAVGWRQDVEYLSAQVSVPPGWRLLAVSGADRARGAWIEGWTLWGVFLVLVICAAVFRLCGPLPAILGVVTLVMIYQREGAPMFIWLALVALLGLLSVTEGKLRRFISWALVGISALWLLIFLPFALSELRQIVHEDPVAGAVVGREFDSAMVEAVEEPAQVEQFADESLEMRSRSGVASLKRQGVKQAEMLQEKSIYDSSSRDYDPDAVIQTGPGVPQWQWDSVQLEWSGPVTEDAKISLYWVPPWLTAIGHALAVVLTLLFAAALVRFARPRLSLGKTPTSAVAATVLAIFLLDPQPAQAGVTIDQELLKTLEQRLTQPPECLPDCSAISRVQVNIDDKNLRVTMDVEAQTGLSMPLPAHRERWMPARVTRAGQAAVVFLSDQRQLFAYLPAGRHRLVLSGPVESDQLELNFGQTAHNFSVESSGWNVSGVRDGYLARGVVQFSRQVKREAREDRLQADPVPAFLQITRRIELGLEWRVVTTAQRIAPQTGAISIQVPLLQGELPLAELPRSGDRLTLNFGANQRQIVWTSRLPITESLTLSAADQHRWAEVWMLQASPVWHVQFEGIPPIKDAQQAHRPVWMPWPGESVMVSVARPPAAEGASLTTEQVTLEHRPGRRSAETDLTMTVRASRGQSTRITLPDGATLESLSIGGRSQPLINQTGIIELPLRPGEQNIQMRWTTPDALEARTSMPQLDLGESVTDINLHLDLPRNRWVLWIWGPDWGPAILVYGTLLGILLAAWLLSRSRLTPLRFHHWTLLGLGFATTNIYLVLLVVAWLFALGWRGGREAPEGSRHAIQKFQATQIGLIVLSVMGLLALLSAIPMGLLAYPDMQIFGNNSSASFMRWYHDRIGGLTPEAGVFSVPLWVYRVAMLLWSLWLAAMLMRWLSWGWSQLSQGGFWHSESPAKKS